MLLTEVYKYIKYNKIYNLSNKNINFNYIYSNSKIIKKNSLFVVEEKKKINKKYIEEAIKKGAVAILSCRYIEGIKITQFIVRDINLNLKNILYKLYPIKPINSLAITGTNGKTSVAWYIAQICKINKLKNKTYGTLGYYNNLKKKSDSDLTTPNYEILHQISYLKKKNLYNFIFEASSHALDQNRLKDFPINIAAITNITQDHLDYHKNISNYKRSKFKLFTKHLYKKGHAVLNDKIKGIDLLKKKLIKTNKIITYGLQNSNIYIGINHSEIKVKIFKKTYTLRGIKYSNIQIENIGCAIACCVCLNIKDRDILKTLKLISNPPGRLEKIIVKNKNHKVYIDYAHTPDALKQVLIDNTLGNKKPNIIFGCGGNRDKNKRAKMGLIANKFANKVYITDDNPRDEDPILIRKLILSKCKKGIEISNRKEAIFRGLKDLKKNEILIIAGKGHEKKQIIKNSIKYFDDKDVAIQAIKKTIK